MVAEYDKTSFGIQRRQREAAELMSVRAIVVARMEFVKDAAKLRRLEILRLAIDDVVDDLKD